MEEKIIGIVKIGAGGEIQLPQKAQDIIGIKTGDTIEFTERENDNVVILQSMKTITIPTSLYTKIEKHIDDDWIEREMEYVSVEDFVIASIEHNLDADRDLAFIKG